MASILTVQANLNGNASSLVGAAKQASAAIRGVDAAAAAASRNSGKLAVVGDRVGKALGFAANGAVAFGAGIARVGVQAVGTLVRIASRATMAATAMGTLFAGAAMKQGLDRLMAIQDSTVALTRMLGGAAEAAELTGKVLKVVQGTPFAFPQFAEATRQLVAFGVKAEKIPKVLQAIADSAAASGEGAEAVGRITQAFARMAVTGKLNYDIIESLGSAGVNALGLLANHFGITTAEAQEMVSQGMIPADQAMDILVDGIENGSKGIAGDFKSLAGAAQDLGKTISGSLGNVKAAFARMGASWLKPFEKDLPDVMNKGVIPLLDKVGEAGQKMTQKIADTGVLENVTKWFGRLTDNVDPLVEGIGDLFVALSPLGAVWDALKDVLPMVEAPLREAADVITVSLVPALADLFTAMIPLLPALAQLAPVFANGIVALTPAIKTSIEVIINVMRPLLDILQRMPDWVIGLGLAFAGLTRLGVPVGPVLGGIVSSLRGVFDGAQKAGGGVTGFKSALSTAFNGGAAAGALGIVGNIAKFLTGPWGVAIMAGIGAIGLFTDAFDPAAKAAMESFQASLATTTGAITDATRQVVVDALATSGKLDAVKEVAKATGTDYADMLNLVVDASLGIAGAQDKLNAALEAAGDADGWIVGADAIHDLQIAVQGNNAELDKARQKMEAQLIVTGAMTKSDEALTVALGNASTAISTNGSTLDANTTAGQANKTALDNVTTAAKDVMTAMENTGASEEAMTQKAWNMIPALMETFKKFGMNEQAAADLTSEITGIPPAKVVNISTTARDAIPMVEVLKARIDALRDRTIYLTTIRTDLNGDASGTGHPGVANGGLFQNGTKTFAGGGFNEAGKRFARVPQMVFGENITWGEPETGWEAYISGKKSMMQRNRRVWTDAGQRLGMFDGGGPMSGGGTSIVIQLTASPYDDIESLAQRVFQILQFKMG